jgi:hypothetical protein
VRYVCAKVSLSFFDRVLRSVVGGGLGLGSGPGIPNLVYFDRCLLLFVCSD